MTDHRLLLGVTALALSLLGFGFFTDVPALLAHPLSLLAAVFAAHLGGGPGRRFGRRGQACSKSLRRELPSLLKEKR